MKNSLRSQIRLALLGCFAAGSHGDQAEVEDRIRSAAPPRGAAREALNAGLENISIQVSQVRGELMKEFGINIENAGRLKSEHVAEINRKLGLPTVQKKVAAKLESLKKAA